ncbi:SHOCT domain-containing protein [Mycolicibacterium aichiense]|uniref:SHOCT domain-containing protein n=1 Tax=Mycolicibacterium aichiense TaxID=1799 RepID=UPI003D67C378
MMFWYGHDMSGWVYAGMAIGMVVFWVLIIAGIVMLIRYTTGAPQGPAVPQFPPYGESPERLLAARFARGEIDEAEYRQRLAALRASPYQ